MTIDELRFIDRLYRDLYKSEPVLHHSTGAETDKFSNIGEYINTLERIHDKASRSERNIDRLKRLYYDKYVIKEGDIPDSYYNNQKRIALERGFGHITINNQQKEELQKEVIDNQKRSLDTWLDYFLSEDSKFYPFWAKYWAFQGMLKLGSYDKSNGTFNKRTKETVAPFVDLNREALAKSIDLIIKYVGKENIDDEELKAIVASGSFQKIYSYILKNILSDNENIIKRDEGRWIKYNQGSDHMPLVKSLQGYNTGWCTAGESTAKSQLSNGDFYVYYTLDEKGEYKIPRIAIRMEHGNIGEIRGIAKDQNLEPEMEEVVAEKIKDFPDKDKYYKKVNDMKLLTEIYNKRRDNQELTVEELSFLYEIDSKIEGFGYKKDPRIVEIINTRNQREDLSRIFNCDKSQIALIKQEITDNTIYYYGDLDLRNLTSVDGLDLSNTTIGGSLWLSSLTSAEGLKLPQSIGGDLNLFSLTSAEGLKLPQSIGGSLWLDSLTSAEGLILPQSIGEDLALGRLTSAEGLVLPQSIGGYLDLNGLTSAEGLKLPQSIGGGLGLGGFTSAEGLVLPQSIGGDLYLSSLTSTDGLDLSNTTIGVDLWLDSLTSAEGLKLPQSIGGDLFLSRLISADGLVLPQSIEGGLWLGRLISAEGLILPQSIGGSLGLDGFTSAEGLVLPQSIGGNLYLSSLTSANGLDLSNTTIGGDLWLDSLTSVEGLILPDNLTYKIYCNGFTITPENVDMYRNSRSR